MEPANCNHVIGVGASTIGGPSASIAYTEGPASFSNYGPAVVLGAPGDTVYSTMLSSGGELSDPERLRRAERHLNGHATGCRRRGAGVGQPVRHEQRGRAKPTDLDRRSHRRDRHLLDLRPTRRGRRGRADRSRLAGAGRRWTGRGDVDASLDDDDQRALVGCTWRDGLRLCDWHRTWHGRRGGLD